MKWLTYYRLEIVFLCVSYFFFFPHPFFPSRPRTSSHHPSHTCTHCTRYMFERTCAAAAPVSHFTFHPAALLYLSVFFFFFSPRYLQDHFPQPGPVSASTPKNKPSVATGRGPCVPTSASPFVVNGTNAPERLTQYLLWCNGFIAHMV